MGCDAALAYIQENGLSSLSADRFFDVYGRMQAQTQKTRQEIESWFEAETKQDPQFLKILKLIILLHEVEINDQMQSNPLEADNAAIFQSNFRSATA